MGRAVSSEAELLRFHAAAFSAVPHGLLLFDRGGRLVQANPAAEAVFGRPGREIARWAAAAERPFARVLAAGTPVSGAEVAIERPDGSRRVLLLDAAPVRDGGGAVVGVISTLADVTERTAFDEQFLRFLDDAPEPFAVHRKGIFVYLNRAALAALGYARPEDLLSRPVLDIVHPADRPAVAARLRAMVERNEPVPVLEERLLGRDGREVVAAVTAIPIPFPGGPAVLVLAHDLTQQRRAGAERERLLAEIDAQRRLFAAMIDVAPVGVGLLRGPRLVFEAVNPAMQAFAPGIPLAGRPFAEVAPEMTELVPLLERVLATGEPLHMVDRPLPIQRTSGGPIEAAWFSISCVRVRSPGEPDAVLGVADETTEQVRARRRLEELAEERQRRAAELAGILDNMVEGVVVCDAEGRFTLLNRAASAHLAAAGLERPARLAPEHLSRYRLRDRDGRSVPYEALAVVRALAGETVVGQDLVAYHAGTREDRSLRVNAVPIRDGGGVIVGAVAVANDLTELMALDRLKDQFLRVAAHELKTPVTVIKGDAAALLRSAAPLAPAQRRLLEAIDRRADQIDALVRDLLDVSQLALGRLELAREPVPLEPLVRRAAARAARAAPRHAVRVEAPAPPGGLVVVGDPQRLAQVLQRLLDNAVRYSPGGGEIEVALARERGRALVAVTDHGVGIPARRRARIFQRFYRAHTDTPIDPGGMGVGLYICNEIIARHGGEMGFSSEEGVGSRFHFSLPLAEGEGDGDPGPEARPRRGG